ncbi:MAG TPA: proline dehydrogenase family protein [Bacteroidia bacterium]|nr:proline dehydrogenase family protein [Bacteroidia bacterium]
MKNQHISFDDTETAFTSKSNADLNRAVVLFKMISYNWLVRMSPPFVNFAIWAHLPIKGLIKATIFRHFCGGESIDDCQRTIESLSKYHIGTILDYSVEGKESEADFDLGLKQTLATVQRAKGDSSIPFSVFKPSGFVRFALLEKKNAGKELTKDEQEEFERFKNRVNTICKTGFENNVPIYVDAEETWIQDAVDDVVREMMMKYNKEKVMVYNTIQMYRTDRLDFLKAEYQHAVANNYHTGFKIVRGAYMEKERERAKKMGYPTPIQPDKVASDRDYDAAVKFCVDHIDRMAVCAGTHNEQSCLNLVALMEEKKLPHNHPNIWFSQLYGMSDHISYNLAKKGYNVSKYVPYGPVTSVLPYLIRRAQENTSAAGQMGRELSLLMMEKKRRSGK